MQEKGAFSMSEDKGTATKVKAKDHESYGTFTILSIIIPLVGFILGIVYLTKDKKVDKKLGEHLVALSILFGIFWWVLFAMFVPITTITSPNNVQTYSDTLQNTESMPSENKDPAVPAEYKSALAKATQYANTMNMSKQGVYDQLVSEYGEKFKPEAAQYAIDNVKGDWNKNALAKAKSYQKDMNMSPAAIRDQLVSQYGEKFTAAEADYAIAHLND